MQTVCTKEMEGHSTVRGVVLVLMPILSLFGCAQVDSAKMEATSCPDS